MDPFFEIAARSPTRQRQLRACAIAHVLFLAAVLILGAALQRAPLATLAGYSLLLAGIVEGALLLGWRLTQLPKSKAMELLLVTSLSPRRAMWGEQSVGIALYTLVCLAGLPPLALLVALARLEPVDAGVLVFHGYLWGLVVGLGLAWWAYEPERVRRWGERVSLVGLLVYLIVGGLAGERTFALLARLPWSLGTAVEGAFFWFHHNNPFALVFAVGRGVEEGILFRLFVTWSIALGLVCLFAVRAAWRLRAHYVERHYQPVKERIRHRPGVSETAPLTWWAVRRVHEFSGRVNLYLAWGAVGLYAAFLLAGDHWPDWLGTGIFLVFEQMGGVASLTTGLVLLAAVPAAYQFGLWEHSLPERAKRIELLLLTRLDAEDYLKASWSAAWSRGRGYFGAALLLWSASVYAGRHAPGAVLVALAAGTSLVFVYFAIGFRFLANGRGGGGAATGLGLSVALPLTVYGLIASGWGEWAALLPPGQVYQAQAGGADPWVVLGSLVATAGLSAVLLLQGARRFDADLRTWFSGVSSAR